MISQHDFDNATMERPELVESPRKRQKTEDVVATDSFVELLPQSGVAAEEVQIAKELEVGITELVTTDNEGFSGILKKRYAMNVSMIGTQNPD